MGTEHNTKYRLETSGRRLVRTLPAVADSLTHLVSAV
jgi:hypothetical protein